MPFSFNSLCRGATLAGALLASSAQAAYIDLTVDFEDLSFYPAFSVKPSAGYQGFNWGTDLSVICRENAAVPCGPTNYLASSPGSGGIAGSYLITRSDNSAFFFDGGKFWSRRGVDAVGDFSFVLYSGSAVVFNGAEKIGTADGKVEEVDFTGAHNVFRPSYTGLITGMSFLFDNDDYDHLAMDDLLFRVLDDGSTTSGPTTPALPGASDPVASSTVPEPAPLSLLALGLASIGLARRHTPRR